MAGGAVLQESMFVRVARMGSCTRFTKTGMRFTMLVKIAVPVATWCHVRIAALVPASSSLLPTCSDCSSAVRPEHDDCLQHTASGRSRKWDVLS
ncbi:MAG: hypothetical protein CMJ62_10605 [Planctomycetaceae bacterium]|nr:hypothetical protein [Planctomycetaceae bacterium]